MLGEQRDRQVDRADHEHREGDGAHRRHVGELAGDDERCDRIEQRHQQHLGDGDRLHRPAEHPGPHDDHRDAEEADEDADDPGGVQHAAVPAAQGDERGEQGHGRHEQAGEARVERLLGMTEEEERPAHLHDPERQHPGPVPQRGAQGAAAQRERQEEHGGQQGASGDDRTGRVRVDRDADEQVGHAPQHGHGGQQQPPPLRDDAADAHSVRRPSNARPSVTSSAYSRSPPTGRPEASRDTVICMVVSSLLR